MSLLPQNYLNVIYREGRMLKAPVQLECVQKAEFWKTPSERIEILQLSHEFNTGVT